MTAGNWRVITVGHNSRVYNASTREYVRDKDGAVMVFPKTGKSATRAADRMNGAKPAPGADELAAKALIYALVGGEL